MKFFDVKKCVEKNASRKGKYFEINIRPYQSKVKAGA